MLDTIILTGIYQNHSGVKSVNIKQCPIISLDLSYNQLTALDLSTNNDIKIINVSNNDITELDVSHLNNINILDVRNNLLSFKSLKLSTKPTTFV
jgi:Leucine-rich repeat (LRR) protein